MKGVDAAISKAGMIHDLSDEMRQWKLILAEQLEMCTAGVANMLVEEGEVAEMRNVPTMKLQEGRLPVLCLDGKGRMTKKDCTRLRCCQVRQRGDDNAGVSTDV